MVASPIEEIGSWIYVYGVQTDTLLRCRVTDTSQARDRARHLRTRRFVELDYASAQVLCGTTNERPERCPVVIVHFDRE